LTNHGETWYPIPVGDEKEGFQMSTFEVTYTFQNQVRSVVVEAVDEQDAIRAARITHNPTAVAKSYIAPPVIVSPKQKRTVRIQSTYSISEEHAAFLEFLRTYGTIRVQLPPQSVLNFQENYRRVTGQDVEAPSEHVSIITPNAKWGLTFTVLFPSSGLPLVPPSLIAFPYTQATPDTIGICNNQFAWELLSVGFRLGRNSIESMATARG
jgi:hypothetical protein